MALERCWLTATLRGLAFQPITGMTFLGLRLRWSDGQGLSVAHQALVRRWLAELELLLPTVRSKIPLMLFRVGRAAPPSDRARRQDVGRVLSTQ
jgi:hypothetical protein